MASFVSISTDEEQVIELAKYLNKLQNKGKEQPDEKFVQECTQLQSDSKYEQVLNKIIDENPLVFADGNEKDIESFFLVVIGFAKKLPAAPSIAVLTKIQNVLASTVDDKASLRIKLLNDLYNIVEGDKNFRYNLYLALVKYTIASHNVDLIIKEFSSDQLNNRIKQWGLKIDQIRNLYKLVRDTFKEAGKSIESYNWAVKYLVTYEQPDQSILPEAVAVALEAIKLPNLLQFDALLELPVVKQMENSKDNSKLFQLLKIFVGENFESYKSFIAQNVDFLKSTGLKEEECTLKMRLLSLATLGAANPEVAYSSIAKTLQINEDEVESWVITAMSEDVLDAKMDQLRRVVTINRCLQRVFTKVQWKQLSDDLLAWKNNTKNILKTVQETKQQAINKAQS